MDETIFTISVWFIAILLGVKHSFDVDHLIAVSGFLSNSSSSKRSATLSISWALGHMVTATIITILLFIFRETLLNEILKNMELLVAFMLIIMSILTFAWEFELIHFHRHTHTREESTEVSKHSHLHIHLPRFNDHESMVGIGFIHGLASNDELLILMMMTLGISELWAILIGVVFFTFGVVIGMIAYGVIVNFPSQKYGQKRVTRIVNVTIASVTLVYAFWLLLGLEGLNIFDIVSSFLSGK